MRDWLIQVLAFIDTGNDSTKAAGHRETVRPNALPGLRFTFDHPEMVGWRMAEGDGGRENWHSAAPPSIAKRIN